MTTHRDFLASHTVGDLVATKPMIIAEAKDTDSVESVMATMAQFKLLSVAVWAPQGQWMAAGGVEATASGGKQYIGIISTFDILLAAAENPDQLQTIMQRRVVELVGKSLEGRSLWVWPADKRLDYAMDGLAHGVHRVLVGPLQGPNGEVGFKIVTQTDIARCLHDNVVQLGPIVQQSIGQMGLVRGVLAVNLSQNSMSALQKMSAAGVNGAAVVDNDGHLKANFSASDLRGMTAADISRLELNVIQFLETVHGGAHHVPQPVVCHEDSSLQFVLNQTLKGSIHRVWIVDGDNKPIGVVTLSDILAVFTQRQ